MLRVHVAGRARFGVHLVHRRSGIGWDVQARDARGTARAEGTTLMAMVELDL